MKVRPSPFFPCLLSIAFPDFGLVGQSKKKSLEKLEKVSELHTWYHPQHWSLLWSLEETGKQQDNFEHKIHMVEESFGWCY